MSDEPEKERITSSVGVDGLLEQQKKHPITPVDNKQKLLAKILVWLFALIYPLGAVVECDGTTGDVWGWRIIDQSQGHSANYTWLIITDARFLPPLVLFSILYSQHWNKALIITILAYLIIMFAVTYVLTAMLWMSCL
jgi:hypothetical protein